MPLSTDTVLGGRYRLGQLLGRGGMAEVYDAVDERLDRPVAVKVLRPEMGVRLDVRRRFEAEARAAARLSHPNVVAVFDTGEDDGVAWIVMERLPGETLADRMGNGPLDADWIGRVAGDVLGALGAAHHAGLIHRDIKPANILIGADGCAKVADFGIAKSLEIVDDQTHTGQLVGTPAYLAPERIDGEPATPCSDLYALGVVLYEALAGEKPFRGTTPVSVAYAVRHTDPPRLADIRPELSPHLVGAVERAMARRQEDRFTSAEDMARALHVGLGGDDITVLSVPTPRPDAATEPTTEPVTEILDAAPSAGVPLEALVPGAPQRPWTARAGVARMESARWLVVGLIGLLIVLLAVGLVASTGDAGGDELSADLRDVAEGLDASDGARATDAAARLQFMAQRLEGQPENSTVAAGDANTLLTDLAGWQSRGELASGPVARVKDVVLRIPGANEAAFAVPTTTTVPPPAKDEGDGDKDDEKDGDKKKDDD